MCAYFESLLTNSLVQFLVPGYRTLLTFATTSVTVRQGFVGLNKYFRNSRNAMKCRNCNRYKVKWLKYTFSILNVQRSSLD